MSDTLRLVSEELAKAFGGTYRTERFCEILHPEPPDTRTEEEKFYGIIHSMGLKVVE